MIAWVTPEIMAASGLIDIGFSLFAVGWIIPAIMAGSAVVKTGISMYANRKKKTRNFENTDYGKYLQGISERGVYSPKAKAGILGQVSRQAGGIASRQTAATRGQLASRGMENSIAGTRALSAPGTNMMNIMADKASQLETQNEMSKVGAGRELAMGKNRSREIRRGEDSEMYNILAGGIGETAGPLASMAGGIQEDAFMAKIKPEYDTAMQQIDELIDAGQWEQANALVMKLSMMLGGPQ